MSSLVFTRRLRWLTAWLVWLGLSGAAWAGYDARVSELRDTLQKTALDDAQERTTLQKALDDWSSARLGCLQDLVHIVEETSASSTEQERRWVDRIDSAESDLARSVGDSLKPISTPSLSALKFRELTLNEEDKFLRGLQQVHVAQTRDAIVDNQQKLTEMIRILDEKWRALQEQDRALDDGEKGVVDQLRELVDKAVEQAAWQRRTFKEKLADGVTKLLKVPRPQSVDTVLDGILTTLADGGEWWLARYGDYDGLVSRYSGYVDGERGGIFVLFAAVRKDTQDFVDKNGFDRMKERYQKASAALDDWRGNLPTSAQKRDADELANDLRAKLSGHLSASERLYNEFVGRNRDKFFGPVGPDVRELLVERRIWEDRVRMLLDRDLESRLREWRSDADSFWSVDFSGLSSDDRDAIKRALKDRIAQIIDAEEKLRQRAGRVAIDFDRKPLDDDIK